MPGEPPGIYGCDYQTLARISVLHAEARMALLHREPKASDSYACLHMLSHADLARGLQPRPASLLLAYAAEG